MVEKTSGKVKPNAYMKLNEGVQVCNNALAKKGKVFSQSFKEEKSLAGENQNQIRGQ